jgi:hypothetical protein
MALISEGTVRRGLRRLSTERALSFVADLWAARGAETTVDDERGVVEVRRNGRTERLRVVTGRRVPDPTTDDERLVLLRPAARVRGVDPTACVDADDVRQLLLYGVPREEAATLCRRYFDRPLRTEARTADRHPWNPVRLTERTASVAVGLVGLLLLVASVFGGPVLVGGPASEFGAVVGAQSASEPGAQTTSTAPDPNATDGAVADERSLQAGALPPGVGSDGDIDEGVLANAHARAVTGQSYRWTITHREFVDGRETAYRRETVFVASPTRYRTELTGAGRLRESTLSISSVEAYADGSSRFEHRVRDDGFDRGAPRPQSVRGIRNDEGRYADRAEQYLDWYLSVSASSIADVVERDGTRYFWVTLGADPYPGVENSSGSALVDENGVVHEVRRRYDVPRSDGVSVVVSFRYTDFGTTTVSPPAWHEATNTTVAPTPTTTPSTETATNTTETAMETPTNRSRSQERVPAATVSAPTAKAGG